jgi:hypothetical protein
MLARLSAGLFLSLWVTGLAAAAEQPAKADPPPFDPTDRYQPQEIEGWKVLVNRKLLDEQPALAQAVQRELQAQLYHVARRVPGPALEKLRKVTFWVELTDRDVQGMCYHPSTEWLKGHGFNPEKAGGVEIGNARHFVDWSAADQPWMALHELAHAYHHQVLGYEHPGIKAAFKKAVESKSYESVLYCRGGKKRHYALNNDQEYFAESCEAFFGVNDFYPFLRAELREHDPGMHELLREVWGEKPAKAKPDAKPDVEPKPEAKP